MVKHCLVMLCAAAVVAMVAPQVQGQQIGGAYARVGGMYVMPTDSDIEIPSGREDGNPVSYTAGYELDSGPGVTLAVGATLGEFRGELEFGRRRGEVARVRNSERGMNEEELDALFEEYGVGDGFGVDYKVNTLSVMGNLYWDVELDRGWSLYVGAGLGAAWHEVDVPGSGKIKDTVFAYQFMAGPAYALSDNIDLYAGYRFFGTSELKTSRGHATYSSHGLDAGLQFGF